MNSISKLDYCLDRSAGASLLPYGLNTLSDPESKHFEEHLLSCPTCANELAKVSLHLKAISIQRLVLVQHFHITGRTFEQMMQQLVVNASDA
ncbi:MAG: hypothetical protein H6508_08270 [Calditrichaeota bacterium]|nr:hypothetical protein [Calditrichota bacterium]